ncbi:MAG: ion channel [Campylobacterota bacterium]|nr:ion channel [Campylobacterota bacterium]
MNLIKKWIVDFSYFLTTSSSYQKKKRFFYNLLENSSYRYKKYFDIFMITLIFISVGIFIREVKTDVGWELLFFNNYIISFIFLIEYLFRYWVNNNDAKIIIEQNEYDAMLGDSFNLSKALKTIVKANLKYIFSFKAIIDLLAIVPFFHQLRLLRIFIVFRVFKLFRYAKSIQTFTSVIASKKFEFITLLVFASIVVFVSSVLIYVMEANNQDSPIDTLFEAIYWAIVTISTVGYGDITPITEAGRVVAMFVIVAGIAVYSFTTSLIVTSFTEKLDEIKDTKLKDDIAKLKHFYVICGYENISRVLGKKLKKHSEIVIIEKDKEKADIAIKDGFIVLNQDPGSISSYNNLDIDIDNQVKAIICLGSNDVDNVFTALTIRSFNKRVKLLSILISSSNRSKLMFTGVDELFYEKELVGVMAKEFVGKSVAFEAIHAMRTNYNGIELQELLIDDRIIDSFTTVAELNNQKYRLVLLGVYKKNKERFFFNPIDSTLLELGDYLLMIGNVEFLKLYTIFLHKKAK